MFLWMGSGWWSLAGLFVDIVGFGILAWDLLPEIRLNRARRALASIRNAVHTATWYIKGEDLCRDREELSQVQEAMRDGYHNQLEDIPKAAFEAIVSTRLEPARVDELRELTRTLRGKIGGSPGRVTTESTPALNLLAELIYTTEQLRMVENFYMMRRRPPLMLGIGLVLIGFVLQAWGSVPIPGV